MVEIRQAGNMSCWCAHPGPDLLARGRTRLRLAGAGRRLAARRRPGFGSRSRNLPHILNSQTVDSDLDLLHLVGLDEF